MSAFSGAGFVHMEKPGTGSSIFSSVRSARARDLGKDAWPGARNVSVGIFLVIGEIVALPEGGPGAALLLPQSRAGGAGIDGRWSS